MEGEEEGPPAEPLRRKAATEATINMSKKSATRMKRVSSILRKKNDSLTKDDRQLLEENAELVEEYHKRRQKRAVWESRKTEQEDTAEVLQAKCEELAQAIHDSEFLVAYTGAGISTAASIPDYRGPNGIWTLLQKGQDIGHHDLSAAEPTLTHMALSALYHQGIVHHVVSQNCDGLHLRSGLPKSAMSEVHGNMYIEVCIQCVPAREYVRTMDVTEKTSTFKHTTGRRCYRCGEPLIDTIVHFGERGRLRWPLNWQGACQAANACDTILCLGSSLKVLKKYPWLWQMGRSPKKRPRLYIVNLQWTPKDKDATLKINGKCDEVMARVMKALGFKLPRYSKTTDPIFTLATPLHRAETNTASRACLVPPRQGEEQEQEEEADVENLDEGEHDNKHERLEQVLQESEENRKRKLDDINNEVKEEKCEVKEESKDSIKPINGLHLNWNVGKLLQDGVSEAKYLKTESSDGESKPMIETKKEVKKEDQEGEEEEEDLVADIKEEEEEEDEKDSEPVSECGSREFDPLQSVDEELEPDQQGMTDDEVKSEPVESDDECDDGDDDGDEDLHTSDMDGEPWEHTPDTYMATDSDSSEKEDCHTEDSDTAEQKENQVDYFKLAYASTNVQMARQGQALLKQNDFYGTGLCIRSFANCPKGERNKVGVSQGPRKARECEVSSEACVVSSDGENPEMCSTSVPYPWQPCEAVSSSDNSECVVCGGCRDQVLSSSSVEGESGSCNKCRNVANSDGAVTAGGGMERECSEQDQQVSESHSNSSSSSSSSSSSVKKDTHLPGVNVITPDSVAHENLVVKTNNVLCHRGLDLPPSMAGDGSFLLRTRIVDGIITTTCVESLAAKAKEEGECGLPYLSKSPVPCSSQTEVSRLPVLTLTQKALRPHNKSAIYIDNSVSEAHVKAITEHLQCQRSRNKFSSELSKAESAELKSIWYQSFCGPNTDTSLSALTVMMEMNDCNLGRDLTRGFHSKATDLFANSEKSSSVILKNICAEAVSDSAARHRTASTNTLRGSDDDNVKCIWFWGFDSSAEAKEKTAAIESPPEGPATDNGEECHPVGRITRSRTRASCDTSNQASAEEEVLRCHCSGANPELCRIASLRPSQGRCDDTIQRARDTIRRRRTVNYRRYEPVFEKKMVSLTYERTRAKRKSKFDVTAAAAAAAAVTATVAANHKEEEEEHDMEGKEEEHKVSDGEDCRDRDEKEERKFVPGWYGKGLRKGMKKKSRV